MRCVICFAPLLLLCAGTLRAQDRVTSDADYQISDPMNVAITARGGVTLASARGTFPSLIIGESRRSTGSLGQELATSEVGSRIDVAALIPFARDVGISVAIGSQLLSVRYPADTIRMETRFDVQQLQAALGVQWSALNEQSSYEVGGLRSIYLDAGFDVGLSTLGNRVEGTTYDDTLGGGKRAAVGSFFGSEPFRTVVALRGGVGMRFAATPNIEIVLETSYSHALNAIFSSEAIEANDFTLDVMRGVLGVGYRF